MVIKDKAAGGTNTDQYTLYSGHTLAEHARILADIVTRRLNSVPRYSLAASHMSQLKCYMIKFDPTFGVHLTTSGSLVWAR